MKTQYLLPHKYKKIGWMVLIPSGILGLITLIMDYEPSLLNMKVPAIFISDLSSHVQLIGLVETNILNEVLGILVILSGICVAFSREMQEDEFITHIRLESLVWATYVNYGVLLLAFLLVYDISFLWVMIFNMFTILIFFIIRFNWQLSRLNKSTNYEK